MEDRGSGAELPFFRADFPIAGVLARERFAKVLAAGDLVARAWEEALDLAAVLDIAVDVEAVDLVIALST
jgi:hypothetical protein